MAEALLISILMIACGIGMGVFAYGDWRRK
jgi:hypothetical protein